MWRLNLIGSSSSPEDETDVRNFLRRTFAAFENNGSPTVLSNAQFEGSHGGNDNLLNNLEVPKPVAEVLPPAPRATWDETIPVEVPGTPELTAVEQQEIADRGPETVVHMSADASGTTGTGA